MPKTTIDVIIAKNVVNTVDWAKAKGSTAQNVLAPALKTLEPSSHTACSTLTSAGCTFSASSLPREAPLAERWNRCAMWASGSKLKPMASTRFTADTQCEQVGLNSTNCGKAYPRKYCSAEC